MHDDSRLRALAQHSSNDIVVIDSAGRLVYAVPSAEGKGVAGYTLLDLKGQNVMDLAHPADRARALAALSHVIGSPGETLTLHTRIQHQDGRYRHVEVVASNHLNDPSIEGIVLNLQDITDSVTAEHRQDIFLEMLGSLDVSTAILLGDHIVRANDAFCRLTGYTEAELQGLESAFDLICDGVEGLRHQLARREKGQTTRASHECTFRRSDGNIVDVQLTFRVADDYDDGPGLVAIVEDITERKLGEAARQAEIEALESQVGDLRKAVARKYDFDAIVGAAPAMQRVYFQMEAAIDSGLTVLITGATGAGKELIAQAIHHHSPRGSGGAPAKEFNCGAIPRELMASQLFGHRKGSFTGADRDTEGMFEAASGGTLILDEIGEMGMDAQILLLRVLEERTVMRLSETTPRQVDVRVIAITNRHLPTEIEAGRFREDLYYRLNVIAIQVPALRDRREDIPRLSERFLADICERIGKDIVGFGEQAAELLLQYAWPGNIRELQNAVHSAAALAPDGGYIDRQHFPAEMTGADALSAEIRARGLSYKDSVAAFRRQVVQDALLACDGNRTQAAEMLSMKRPNLVRLLRELDIRD